MISSMPIDSRSELKTGTEKPQPITTNMGDHVYHMRFQDGAVKRSLVKFEDQETKFV